MTSYFDVADADLLARHAEGDAAAFAELVRRHRDRMWAVATHTLGDPHEAADAVQEALISAFRKASSFRGDAAVTTWLYRIVVNACLDRLRRQAVRAVPDQDAVEAAALNAAIPDPACDTDLALDVSAALRLLPVEQRTALVLVDMMGYRIDDVAGVLGVPPGTVKSRCARGRARLAGQLAYLRNRSATSGRHSTGSTEA